MTHLCVPPNQALGVYRWFVPDIQVCGTHGREDLVNATITSKAEEEEKEATNGAVFQDTSFSAAEHRHQGKSPCTSVLSLRRIDVNDDTFVARILCFDAHQKQRTYFMAPGGKLL